MFFNNWFYGRADDGNDGGGNNDGHGNGDVNGNRHEDDDAVVPPQEEEDGGEGRQQQQQPQPQPQPQPQEHVQGHQAAADGGRVGEAEANNRGNQNDEGGEEGEQQHQAEGNGAAAAAAAAAAGGGGVDPQRPLLISEEEWFRLNTLRDANSQQERYDDGTPNHNNLVQQRVNDEQRYANRVIQDAFRQDEEASVSSTTSSSSSMIDESERREKQLKKWKKQKYQLQIETFEDYQYGTTAAAAATTTTSCDEVKKPFVTVVPPPLQFPLHVIASRSETIYTMASSMFNTRFLTRCLTSTTTSSSSSTSTTMSRSNSSTNSSNGNSMVNEEMGGDEQQYDQHQQEERQEQEGTATKKCKTSSNVLVLPLRDYPRTHVEVFFRLLLGEIDPIEIPDDAVIDCCRLAHYLQCDRNSSSSSSTIVDGVKGQDNCNNNNKLPTNMEIVPTTRPATSWGHDDVQRMTLVEEIADVCLNPSVDSTNCMSLCQLAAQFELDTLRDISLNHIVTSLSTLEGHEFWDELPLSLRTEIEKMRTIMQNEQHLHGGKATKKKLFFNSCREYIALLEEQYEYHLERLEDANFEQQQKALEIGMCYRTHSSWLYAQFKIERHASKVRALKQFLDEQRRIFGSSSSCAVAEIEDGRTSTSTSTNDESK